MGQLNRPLYHHMSHNIRWKSHMTDSRINFKWREKNLTMWLRQANTIELRHFLQRPFPLQNLLHWAFTHNTWQIVFFRRHHERRLKKDIQRTVPRSTLSWSLSEPFPCELAFKIKIGLCFLPLRALGFILIVVRDKHPVSLVKAEVIPHLTIFGSKMKGRAHTIHVSRSFYTSQQHRSLPTTTAYLNLFSHSILAHSPPCPLFRSHFVSSTLCLKSSQSPRQHMEWERDSLRLRGKREQEHIAWSVRNYKWLSAAGWLLRIGKYDRFSCKLSKVEVWKVMSLIVSCWQTY